MIVTSILYLIYCGLVTVNATLPHESLWGHSLLKDGLILQIIIVLTILIRPQININILFLGFVSIIILSLLNYKITDHIGTQAGIISIFATYFNSSESFNLSIIPLTLIGNRSSLLSIIPLLNNHKFKSSIILIIISFILTISSFKMINAPGLINIISSGRIYHYQIAVRAIIKNPWGYGFNGYRFGYLSIIEKDDYLLLGRGYYQKFGKRGKVKTRSIPFAKCHNIILDKILDIGIPGFLLWLNLIRLNINVNNKNLVLSYLIFIFFWYESFIISLLFWILIVQDLNSYDKIDLMKFRNN